MRRFSGSAILLHVLVLAVAGTLRAQTTGLSTVSVTPQQAVLQYKAPDNNPCTVAVTDNSGRGVTVWDVNGTVFAGANQDLNRANTLQWDGNRTRQVVLGKRSAEVGLDGKLYSRSLQVNTAHTATVTCTGGAQTISFQTLNLPVGNMAPDPPAFNAAGFGNAAWPSIQWFNKSAVYIDPKTGVLLRPAAWPGDLMYQNSGTLFNAYYDASGTWTNAAKVVSGGPSQLAISSTTNPIFVSLNPAIPAGSSNWTGFNVLDLRVNFLGNGSGSPQQVDFCLTADSGQTCLSATQSVMLPASTGIVSFPSGTFPTPPFSSWGIQKQPEHNLVMPVTTTVSTAGTTVNNLATVPTDVGLFPTTLPAGSKVVIAGSPCPNNLCTVAAVGNSAVMTVNETVGTLNNAAFTAANFGLKVWKHVTGGAIQLSLNYDVVYGGQPGFLIADGASDQCNRNAVSLTENAAGSPVPAYTANLCLLSYSGGGSVMFAFIPATGELRPVGMVYTTYGSGMSDVPNPAIPQNPWDTLDPRTLYGQGSQDSGSPEVVRWVYRGQGKAYTTGVLPFQGIYRTVPNGQSDGITSCNSTEQQAGNLCASLVTDQRKGTDLRAQAQSKNTNMAKGAFGLNPFPVGVVGHVFVSRWYLQQDGITMFSYVDLSSGVMTTATDTMWSTSNARWGGMHTAAGWVVANHLHLAAVNPLGSRFNAGPFAGPYKSRVSFVWRSTDGTSGTWDSNTAVALGYSYPCPSSVCGTTVGNALRIRISGMPCSASANAAEYTNYPCPWSAMQGMPAPLQVGDVLGDLTQPNGGAFSEELKILSLTVNNSTDIDMWVQRATMPGALQSAFSNGWSASPFPSSSCTSGAWWFDIVPKAPMVPDDCGLAGHIDVGVGQGGRFSSTNTLSAKFSATQDPSGISAPLYQLGGFGTWAQQLAGTNFPGNGRVEEYPSLRQWSAPESEKVWAADWRAYQGGTFAAGGAGTQQDNITFTQITTGGRTHVWKALSGYTPNPKVLPMETWAGRYIFQDISGPGSNLTDANNWSYCVVYKAGECIQGASTAVGDVYFSAAAAIANMSSCFTNHMEAALPCLVPASPLGTWAVQDDISRKDIFNRWFRRLTMAFNAPSRQYTATNWRSMPDASWGFMLTTYADGISPVMFVAKLPPWPGYDQVRRDDFIPQTVKLGSGAALAEVRFGYEEYGTPGQFYCTSRKESCVSRADSVLFNYVSADGHAGTSCATGCSVTVPGLPGRILWWQEFRSSDGITWSPQGQLKLAPTP